MMDRVLEWLAARATPRRDRPTVQLQNEKARELESRLARLASHLDAVDEQLARVSQLLAAEAASARRSRGGSDG